MNESRFIEIHYLMRDAYDKGELEEAKQLAKEYLNLANENMKSWNYGNALHHGNIVLGLIAIKRGEIDKAKEFLILSTKTPGSPQLRTFGPNLLLANELFKIGESEVVVQFLESCKSFWWRFFSAIPIWKWKRKIMRGEIPNFGSHIHF